MTENNILNIFRSSTNNKSIINYKSRYNRTFRYIIRDSLSWIVLIALEILLSIIIYDAILNNKIFFLIFSAILLILFSSYFFYAILEFYFKKDPLKIGELHKISIKESKKYYVEMYPKFLFIYGNDKIKKIKYDEILDIKKFERNLEPFMFLGFDRIFEQRYRYPYIFIATSNNTLYSIITKKNRKGIILDIADIDQFNKIIRRI